MKKLFVALFTLCLLSTSAFAATWVAADRVSVVGAKILEKNGLPTKTKFKVVNGAADNSTVSTTNVINISSTDLSYAGNDNEVAAVIGYELGHIVNGKCTKSQMRNFAKSALTTQLSSDNILTTAANSEYLTSKENAADNKAADVTGADLIIKAGYNPLAAVVVITKMPGSTMDTLQGRPCNAERAMYLYDYLTYNYPSKVKTGYACQEYTRFLDYANPIVKKRNADSKKLKKFNAEQEKNKQARAKSLNRYKNTGTSGWDASYQVLKSLTESSEK